MKNYIIISALIICSTFAKVKAQTTHLLDTIYANDTKNVALFFPEPIRQGITGSDNFVFPNIIKKQLKKQTHFEI